MPDPCGLPLHLATQLLWRLKRVEHALGQCWTVLKCEIERTVAHFKKGEALQGAFSSLTSTRGCFASCGFTEPS